MTRSKRLLNIFLAVAFALLTFGMALAVVLPALSQTKGGGSTTVEAADADNVLSTLATKNYDGQTFYVISTAEQLTALSFKISVEGDATWADRNFELGADINLQQSSVIWTPIGTTANPFSGKFNGNGHMITGLVSGFEGAADENLGLFGKVAGDSSSDPAMIYDLVLDDFAFSDYVANPETSGRLIGYVENAVLLDIYDLSYALSGTIDYNRPLKTIGTVGANVRYYIGDTFTANGTTYIPGVNFDPTHGGDTIVAQFDYANPASQPISAGHSIYIRNAANATIYEKGASTSTSIAPYKIALNTDGTALTVYSSRYYSELPQENDSAAANGQPVIQPNVGKKLTGWTLGGGSQTYTSVGDINISTLASSYHYMDAVLADLTYTITVVRGNGAGGTVQVAQITIGANSTWESAVEQIEQAREGYYLTDLYQNSTHYYTNSISYDESWNVVDNPEYPSGSRINAWSSANVTLNSTWVGQVSNATILFTNENDTGASLDAMTNLSIVYTDGEPVNSPDLELQRSNDVSGQYTFRAVADQKLTFNFTLPAGYKAMSASNNQGGASLTGGTDGVYTVAINGLLTSGGVVTIPIEREQITLNVSAQNFTISLSGQTGFTTISDNVIKTRVGEKFNIVATPANGYEYASFDVTPGFTTISTPTIASNDVATFPVVVNTFGDSQTLTITSRAKAFTIILDYEVTGYEDLSGVELPELTIFDGTRTVTTKQDAQWDNFTPSNLVTITTTGNAYFNSGVVTLETTSDGSLSGSDGNYQIIPPSGESLIPGGSVFRIKVTYSAKQYTATYDGKFATVSGSGEGSTASNFTAIKDLNGSGISDSNSVIQITADTTYKFGDTITLSYNIVSSYYEFVGWYYSNGEYISNQNNATITAGTNNMTIYAVVKGKTATFNVATGSLIKNYDGTTSSYDKGVALSTPNVNSVSFTYGTPSSGSVSFTLTKGYNGGEYILYNASSSGNPFEQYESGTAFLVTTLGNSISGYNSLTFAQNQNAESVFFDHAGWTLYPIVMQRTISVQAAAGDGSVVSGSESATSVRRYYYGGDGFDISYAINAFKKTGYTASGWSFVLGGQTHNVTDSNILSQGKYLIDFASFNGIDTYLSSSGTITVNRTYSANTYKLYFNQNSGEVLNTTELKHDSTGYYKEVVYDQQIGKLPSITKQGYVFAGWGVNATDLYQTDGNKTVNASWTNQSYVVQINFNGGKVSGQNTMNVNVTYDGSIGTFNKYTANGLASLASQVQRDGFVFDAWHYMVPTTTGDGTTYQYVKEVSDTDILNSSTFAYANFDSTTDPVVYIYAGWQFDEAAYSATVSANTKTYDAQNVVFNVSVTANGTSYPLSSSQTNLPSNAGVTISNYTWQYNDGPFSGTAHIYGPEIQNVSQSGTYEVTFTLTDTSSINVEGIAPQPLTITASTDVTINKATLKGQFSPDMDGPLNFIKYLITANYAPLKALGDEDGLYDAVLTATNFNDFFSTWAGQFEVDPNTIMMYVYMKPAVAYLNINEGLKTDFLNFASEQFSSTNPTLVEYANTFFSEEFFNQYFIDGETFVNWMQSPDGMQIFSYMSEFFPMRILAGSKVYDGTAQLSPINQFEISLEGWATDVVELGEVYYTPFSTEEDILVADAESGLKDLAIEVIGQEGFDVNNFTNIIEHEDKTYVLGKTLFRLEREIPVFIFAPTTTLTMTETTGIERSNPYTFELSAEYTYTDELTQIVAEVSTSSGAAGVYSFLNGNLSVTSFRAYVDDTNYFTVENQDGTFVVTGAPSGMQTTGLNLDNLLLYIDGEFEIVAASSTTAVEFDSVAISANAEGDGIDVSNITEGENYNISISSVRVEIGGSAENISVSLDQETYYSSNGTFVFQIVDNGTRAPILYATSYVTNITVAAQSLSPALNRHLLSIVQWQEGETYYRDLLTGASTFASNLSTTLSINASGTGDTQQYVAVYADATYVTISSVTDQGSNASLASGNAFVNFSNTNYQVSNTAPNAYTLTEWTSAQGATVDESGVVTFAATPITSLVAHYSLAAPVGSVSDVNQDASADGLNLSSLISHISLTNSNEAISYSYKWFRLVGEAYQEISSMVSTTAGNGKYAVEVTASQNGYTSVTSQKLTFTVTFNKVDLTITNSSTENLTYNNQDFALTYQINYTIGSQSYSMSVSEALNNNAVADGDKLIITSLQKDGSSVTSIRDAGKYTLTFSLFDYSGNDYNPQNIYNLAGTKTITITVSQAPITLTEQDASFTKTYGSSDPTLSRTVNGVNGETFTVTFKRAPGEAIGEYAITKATSQNSNYTVVLPSNDNWFTITPRTGLVLSADLSGSVTHVYNNAPSTGIAVEYDQASNGFNLTVQGTGEWLGTLSLSNFRETSTDGLSRTVNAFDGMLDGLTFTVNGVNGTKDVGSYTIAVSGTATYSGAKFSINNSSSRVVSITKLDVELNQENSAISKFYGEADNLTKKITVESTGETFNVTFTREPGDDVGTYNYLTATFDNDNYNPVLPDSAEWFTIVAIENLFIQASITEVYSRTYDATAPDATVAAAFVGGQWRLTVSSGSTVWKVFVLSGFKEVSTTQDIDREITPNATTLSGMTFTIQNPQKHVGSYSIIASGTNANYEGITLEGGENCIQITKATITIVQSDIRQDSKTYGEEDPTMLWSVAGAGSESVNILFTRKAGEDVGTYPITNAEIRDKDLVDNYNVEIANGVIFTINAYDGLRISATASVTKVTFEYNAQTPSISLEYVDSSSYKLVITSGSQRQEIMLTNFVEKFAQDETMDAVTSATLNGITFSIKNAEKKVGTYNIVATGTNANYPGGFVFANSANITVQITPATLTINEVSPLFTKTYGENDTTVNFTTNITSQFSESVSVAFARDDAGAPAGETVGTHALARALSLDNNYTASLQQAYLEITARAGLVLNATVSGTVSHVYDATDPLSITASYTAGQNVITLTISSGEVVWGTITLSNFTETTADGFNRVINAYDGMLDGLTFTISRASAKVGNYTLSVSGTTEDSSASFTLNNPNYQVLEITPKPITLTEENATIRKTYGTKDASPLQVTIHDDQTNKDVAITVTREPGEDVGSYMLLSATSTDTNYTAVLEGTPEWFIIDPVADLELSVSITGSLSQVYNAQSLNAEVVAAFNAQDSTWTLTVYRGAEVFGRFTLSNFVENGTGITDRTITPTANTLAGITFVVVTPDKNAGTYTIQLSGTNANYSSVVLVGGEDCLEITKATITVSPTEASFTKTYGDSDPLLEKEVQGAGETVTLQFTRAQGENVGSYNIENIVVKDEALRGNYNDIVIPSGAAFTITAYEGLQISASPSQTQVSLTYNATVPTIQKVFEDGAFKLVISNSDEEIEITLSNIQELFNNLYEGTFDDSALTISQLTEDVLDGITFSLQNISKNVGEYAIVAQCTNPNYPGGFIFTSNQTVNLTINPATLTISSKDPLFTKEYGSADPTLRAQFEGLNGEQVYVTFTREGAGTVEGERVGTYDLLTPTSQDDNYTAVINPASGNDLFEITALTGLVLRGTLSGDPVSHVYNGVSLQQNVEVTWNEDTQNFTFTVKYADGSEFATFTLGDFNAINTNEDNREEEVSDIASNMLDGITFSVANFAKGVGTYSIVASGRTDTYSSFVFENSTNVLTITPYNVELNAGNSSFQKTYGQTDASAFTSGLVKQINGVNNETFNVLYTREPGENVGNYAILTAQSQDNNYTVTLAGGSEDGDRDWFTITAVADLTLQAEVSGSITHVFNNEVPSASLAYTGGNWVITISSTSGTWGTLSLTNFTEVSKTVGDFVNQNGLQIDGSTLNGLVIDILDKAVTVEEYDLTITTQLNNPNYPSGFAFTSGHTDVIEITKATFTVSSSSANFTTPYGSEESKTNTFTRSVTGVNGYTFDITFTREAGSDVGEYQITNATTTDDNYDVAAVSTPNEWYSITAVEGLTLTGTTDKTEIELTYSAQELSLQLSYVNSNTWQITVSNGSASEVIAFTGFKENFTTGDVDATVTEALLANLVLGFDRTARDVGTYTITVTSFANDNYPGGFVFATNITVDITAYDVQVTHDDVVNLNKTYASNDPTLTATIDGIRGEEIEVTFTREQGEDVGTYNLFVADWDDDNYNVTIPADNKWFEIRAQAGLQISAELTGEAVTQTYDGAKESSVEKLFSDGTFTIRVTVDGEQHDFTLTGFEEVVGDTNRPITATERTLSGIEFNLNASVEDVGTYYLVATGTNANYPGGFTFDGDSNVLVITAKNIELNGTNFALSKTYGQLDTDVYAGRVVSGISGGVGDETFSVEFTREAGENVGNYAILTAQSQDNNYTVTLAGGSEDGDRDWFTITAVADLTLQAEVSGSITHVFNNEVPSASLAYTGGNWVITISSTSGTWGTLSLTNFTEVSKTVGDFVNQNGLQIDGSTLNGLVIDILDKAVTVEEYDLTITTQLNNPNYPSGFAFTSGHTDVIEITKATFTVSSSSANFTTPYGSEESKTNTFTRSVTGVNGYTFDITFTREAGSDVGEYQITNATTTDDNYDVAAVSMPNEWYSITAVEDLTLSATASVSEVELTYNNSVPTISKNFVDSGADSYWQLVISNGSAEVTVDLTDFQENFESPVSITDAEVLRTIFDDIEFSLQNISENVGDYTIIATSTDANYPGGFIFGTVTLSINPATLTISSERPILSKVYGSADPVTLSYTFDSDFGERVEVHFDREQGESVGTYDLTNPQSQDDNYTAVIDPATDNNLFEITAQAGLTLSVEISGDPITQAYDGAKGITVEAEFEDGAWVLKVMLEGEVDPLGTYTLSNFREVHGEDVDNPVSNVDGALLNGFTFAMDRAVKDVGSYSIVMQSNANSNYPGGLIFSNSSAILQITQKDLSVSNIVKEFDQRAAFNTSNDTYSNTADISGLVGGETVVLTGQFESIGVGEGIAINNLAISGDAASNYRLTQTSSTGNIIKNTTDVITINLADTDYTYGEIDNSLSAFAPTIMLGSNSVADYVEITPTIADGAYSAGGYLNQGTYSVEFAVTSNYYTVENYIVEITVSRLDITVSVDGEITKVYDRQTNVVQSLSLVSVLGEDNVTVSGAYENAQPGEDKEVTFTLAGDDADNYNLTNPTSTGSITRATIVISAVLDTEEGGFVDGADAVGTTTFEISYPLVGSAEEALALLTAPSKTGYDFVGWTYGEGRDALTAENIGSVLDGALDAKALTIYADWNIQTFTVTVNVNAEQGSYTISPQQAGSQNVYTYNYWDTITVTAVPNTGYIARQATQTITNISSNQIVNVEFSAARITFTVSVDRNSLYPTGSAEVEFPSSDWTAQGAASATRSILFNALDGVLAKDFLPQINVYGYTLASWNSGETVVNIDDETTLLDVILALNNSFNEDISLSFNANFNANSHTITFNTDGGTPQPEEMPVTYGQPVGVLPTVTKVGYGFIAWVDEEGQTYTQETIFAVDENITLTATWGVGIYEFTVNVTNATVEIRDSANQVMTADGGVYRLSYTETYTVAVLPNAGYRVSGAWTESQPDTFDLNYVTENDFTQATLSNLSGNGSITIPTEAIEHTITINAQHAAVSVKVGDGEASPLVGEGGVFTFTAHTGEAVEITITPEAGYSVTFDEVAEGNGSVSSTTANVYTYTGFTQNSTLNFIASAGVYTATFTFEGGASSVRIISGGTTVAGGIQVTTGTDLVVLPNFEYGYEFASVSANGATYSVDDETGYITFSGFTQSFTVTITGQAREFSMSATVFALDSEHNVQDSAGFSATVPPTGLFGSEVTFTASKPETATGYRFIGWFEGILQAEEGVLNYNPEDAVSTNEQFAWNVTGDRELTAIYEYGVFTIRAYVQGEGQIIYNDNVVADSADGSYFSQQFNYSNQVVLNAQPASGYEFQAWMNGQTQYSTSQQITINVENDLSLTAVFVPGDLTFNLNAGVMIDGVLSTGDAIDGLAYGLVEWGSYSEENGFVKDPNGDSTTVQTQTDASVYVQITVNAGYAFDNIYPVQGGRDAQINLISSTENPEGQTVMVYELTGMSAEYNGEYSFIATFIAQSTSFNIIFQEQTADGGYRQVDAGRISVESAAGVRPSGNMTSNVVVDAVTGTTFEVVANLRIGMSFVDSNIVSSTAGTISGENVESVDDTSTGFTSRLTFSVSGFTGDDATIIIYVTSASYTINFVDYVNEETISLGSLSGLKIGDTIALPEGMALPTRDGYTFLGFYTDITGAGTRYIDATGNGLVWNDNGYYWNGNQYVKQANYTEGQDGEDGTFTLYAVFVINKSAITISAVPSAIQNVPPTVGARVVITNLSDANSWMSDADPFYVEVLYGANINITAPIYTDYEFAYWQIERTDENGETTTETITEQTIEGLAHYGYPQIKLTANYNARVAVSGSAGGTVYYTYEVEGDDGITEVRVDDEAFIPTDTSITLHAEAENGYNFIGWFVGDELLSREAVYRIEGPILAASYNAVFEGQAVTIHIGEYDATHGRITSIMSNGTEINFSTGSFQAKVGDEIAIYIDMDENFEVVWSGAEVQNKGLYYYYQVNIEDFVNNELTLTPSFSQMRGTVNISIALAEGNSASEIQLAGTVAYIDAEGNRVVVNSNTTFEGLIGDALNIEMVANVNYKVQQVTYNGVNVTDQIVDNVLALTLNKTSANDAAIFNIVVTFERDMWIDTVTDDYTLSGEGTSGSPYIISTAEDLSFVSYMVNERGNSSFANAYYRLGANIDLTGKYWSPIGTQENPFNGTFDYDVYTITGVAVVYGYTGDLNRDGVFGYLGANANLTEASNDLMIALIIVGVIIFLILLALLIFFLVRRKRKKDLEELANS